MHLNIRFGLTLVFAFILSCLVSASAQKGFGQGGVDKFLKVVVQGKKTYEFGEPVKLSAITVNFGRVNSYKWLLDGRNIGVYKKELLLTDLKVGKHTIVASATNEKGFNVNSELFSVTVRKKTVVNPTPEPKPSEKPSDEDISSPPIVHVNGANSAYEAETTVKLRADVVSSTAVSSYHWVQVQGITLNLRSYNSPELILTGLKPDYYRFKVTITDVKGQTAEAYHSLYIKPSEIQNKPPIVTISESSQTIILPQNSIQIISSAFDEDGKIVSYLWEQISGNFCKMENRTLSTLSISELVEGHYNFRVTVKDNQGQSNNAVAEIIVKSPPVVITRPSYQPKLKGGPSNAFLNMLLPGLGHYYVSGNHMGKGKKGSTFLISLAYMGSVGGAVYFKMKSDNDYKSYVDLSTKREIQRDALGNIIGSRGVDESTAYNYYVEAQDADKMFKTLASVGAGILVTDFIYTLAKGSKNKRAFNKSHNIRKTVSYNPLSKQATLGLAISF